MSTVLAIQLTDLEAKVVKARVEPGEPISVLELNTIYLSSLMAPAVPAEAAPGEAAAHEELPPPAAEPPMLFDQTDIDSTLGVIQSSRMLYNVLELPFDDAKKIEQIASYQIQDTLPFDLNEFVVDSIVTGETDRKKFRVLSSMLPHDEVARSLAVCGTLGTDPRVLTTGAAALAALVQFSEKQMEGLRAYVEFAAGRCSLVVFNKRIPVHMRDFVQGKGVEHEIGDLAANISCSLARVEAELELKLESIRVAGIRSSCLEFEKLVSYPVQALDLSGVVINEAAQDIHLEDIIWSLGLAASELTKSKKTRRSLLDFRQGQFAFHRAWQEIWNALQYELFYIVTFLVLGFAWYGLKLYSSYSALHQVDERIHQIAEQALPNEGVPFRGELSFMQSKLSDLEDQLHGLGSLTSLTPLESIRELATALKGDIDVSFDSISINAAHVLLRGSVGQNSQTASLSEALKARKDRFCDVKVENKGKTASSRLGFSAEITLCE